MGRLRQVQAQVLGMARYEDDFAPSANHFKASSLSSETQKTITANGLQRVAGNLFICPSKADLWRVADGKILRLTTTVEVDNGESVLAPTGDPRDFLTDALNDLTF